MKNKKIIIGISALVFILVLIFFTIIFTSRKSSSSSDSFKKSSKTEFSTQKKLSTVRSSSSYSKTSISSTTQEEIVESLQSTQITQNTEAALSTSEITNNTPVPSSNEQSEQPMYSTTASDDSKDKENQQKLEAGKQRVRDYFSELNKTNGNKYPLDKVEGTIENFFKFINFNRPDIGSPDEQINLRAEQTIASILNGSW